MITLSPALTARLPGLDELLASIAKGAAQRDHDRVLPFEQIDLIRRARLGALRIPEEQGGKGGTLRELFAFAIALAEADANVAHILRNHYSFVDLYIRQPAEARARAWQKIVAGGAIIGLASAELESQQVGAVKLATTLTPEPGSGYRLNGVKYYSTGTIFSDYVLVRATGPEDRGVSILIPVRRGGVEVLDDWDGMGQRLTGTGTTRFTDVAIADNEVSFDTPGVAWSRPYYNTQAQLFLTAVNAGIARATLADAVALVLRRERSFYYAPTPRPAHDPLLQQTVGQIAANAFAAEAVVLAAAMRWMLPASSANVERAARRSTPKPPGARPKLRSWWMNWRSGAAACCSTWAAPRRPSTPPISTVTGAMPERSPRTIPAATRLARSAIWLEINGAPLPSEGFFRARSSRKRAGRLLLAR